MIIAIIVFFLALTFLGYSYISYLNHQDSRDFKREQDKLVDEQFKKLSRTNKRKLVRNNLKNK